MMYLPVLMGDFPLGRAESSNPKTFHVNDSAGINDKASVVTLSDGTQLMTEQDCCRLFHCGEV